MTHSPRSLLKHRSTQWHSFCSSSITVEFGLHRICTGFLFKLVKSTANFKYSVMGILYSRSGHLSIVFVKKFTADCIFLQPVRVLGLFIHSLSTIPPLKRPAFGIRHHYCTDDAPKYNSTHSIRRTGAALILNCLRYALKAALYRYLSSGRGL